jgi:elongation factor G
MKRYSVPGSAFVNKVDNPGANYERVAQMLKEKLGHHPVAIQVPIGAESSFQGIIDPIVGKAFFFDGDDGEVVREEEVPAEYAKATAAAREKIIHDVADVDDPLAEKFINEEPISVEDLRAAIRRATLALKMTPVMCGSAIKNKGVQLLLDGVVYYLPRPTEVVNEPHRQSKAGEKCVVASDPTNPFVGLAFKLQQDKYGQLTYFRVYQGTVSAGDTIYNVSNEMRKVLVPRMFRMHSDDREEIPSAEAGDIVAFYGVEASSGETFTDGKVNWTLTSMHVPAAVISLAVAPKDRAAEGNFSKALNRFTKEDPTFRVHQDEESQQTNIS